MWTPTSRGLSRQSHAKSPRNLAGAEAFKSGIQVAARVALLSARKYVVLEFMSCCDCPAPNDASHYRTMRRRNRSNPGHGRTLSHRAAARRRCRRTASNHSRVEVGTRVPQRARHIRPRMATSTEVSAKTALCLFKCALSLLQVFPKLVKTTVCACLNMSA